jgi:nitrogen fixation uncharacterized protein
MATKKTRKDNFQRQRIRGHFRVGTRLRCALALGVGLVIFLPSSSRVFGGSTQSNLTALTAEVRKARGDLNTISGEVDTFLGKLSSDKTLALNYDQAAQKNDKTALDTQVRAGGLKTGAMSPLLETPSLWIQSWCSTQICINLPKSAADATKQRAEHKTASAQMDAFLAKLESDRAFATKLEAAVGKGDHAAIRALAREGGLKSFPPTDIKTDKDFKLHFHWNGFHIHMEW